MEYLDKLKAEMEEVSGRWNGDESGWLEEQAHIANDIIEKVDELKELIKELNA